MKPFNLEQAKAGKPVVTRDGRKAKIIYWERKQKDYPIVALIGDWEQDIESYRTDGRIMTHTDDGYDLFMASEKKTGWVNVYRQSGKYATGEVVYDTENEAKFKSQSCIATVPITWEE